MFLLSTVPELHRYKPIFHVIDGVTSSIFVLDYALRLLTVPERTRYREFRPALARLRWIISWEAIVDALSAFPYFIDLVDGRQARSSWAPHFTPILTNSSTNEFAHIPRSQTHLHRRSVSTRHCL
eukprot:5887035-Pleurochrysis_carterae.AAC.1